MERLTLSCKPEGVTSQPGGLVSEPSQGPSVLPCGRSQMSLPHLRELDIFWRGVPPTSMICWPHPIGARERFFGDATPQDPAPADRFSVGVHSGAAASNRPRRPRSRPHCNVKYTVEQVDFILYSYCDLGLPWKDAEANFAKVFPGDAKSGHRRRTGGLQGVYYRQDRRIPTRENQADFDGNSYVSLSRRHLRRVDRKPSLRNGLLATHPERAVKYAWVSDDDKRQCGILCRSRRRAVEVTSGMSVNAGLANLANCITVDAFFNDAAVYVATTYRPQSWL
ncbi:hypothetical protein CGGC5_v005836 [Colletotrichum fructicola Nara gc5]|uniref:Uncharacterized protein n=1 Tax=Colletotrichum fructicola (strain Nara gc5) TaxID=1213859 RepID=A0A7J6JDH6_COLFN|nr:hypothetical protein CGGC5_v005836 [Colletotrichum fructicola Nara gc5]